jgi:hypothetical protein
MSDFDFAGAANVPDFGGAGTPIVPEPTSIPSVAAGGGAAGPQPMPESPTPADPRLAAVMARLQPQQTPPWLQAIRKIAPILGALAAMKQNAGGAFAQSYENAQGQSEINADRQAQSDLRLATILHQQQQEKEARAKNLAVQTAAQAKIDAAALKDKQAHEDKLMRDEWTAQSQGGLIDDINKLIKEKGPEAADQYMKSTTIGSLNAAGLPHTVKDLVDRYAVRAPDGTIVGGKTKTPKETKAGTLEDWVTTAEELEEQTRGRSLSVQERQNVDRAAIQQYKTLAKDPDVDAIKNATARVQLQLDQLRADQLRQQTQEMKDAQADIKPGTKEYGIARDLAYGILSYGDFARMYAFQRAGREQMRKIYDKARELNPDFSPSLFEQGARFAGTPQTKRSLAAVENVESGIPSMIEASNAAQRSGVKMLNERFIIPGGVQMGDKTYSDLQAAHKAFADELSLALGVGTASDLKTKLGLDIADPSLPPEQFESVLKNQVLPFLERRKASLKKQMGPYAASSASEMLPTDQGGTGGGKPVPGMPGVMVY